MLKERDSNRNIQKVITNLPLTLIPKKFIDTDQQLNLDGATKELKLELVYSVDERHFGKETVYLSNEEYSLSYLGIIHPNGNVKLYRLRAVNHNKIDKRVFFYCKDVSRSSKTQFQLDKWEKRINESVELETILRQV
ncbi:hypothetical protein [Enterococcus sp. AZ101]|uniref:hypothetical protein n=1 Tax=Enterococcus sp. AZ101 TaxID=2774742 RepID=UPI003D2C4DCE